MTEPYEIAPASAEDATAQRSDVVRRILALQIWFREHPPSGGSLNTSYERERSDKLQEQVFLQHRSSFLKRWIRDQFGPANLPPTLTLLARAYQVISKLQDDGIVAGDAYEDLLNDIEQWVAPGILSRNFDGNKQ